MQSSSPQYISECVWLAGKCAGGKWVADSGQNIWFDLPLLACFEIINSPKPSRQTDRLRDSTQVWIRYESRMHAFGRAKVRANQDQRNWRLVINKCLLFVFNFLAS